MNPEDAMLRTVVQLAAYIARYEPGVRGFSPQHLWRMRQFFVAYRDDPKLSPLLRELPWAHNCQGHEQVGDGDEEGVEEGIEEMKAPDEKEADGLLSEIVSGRRT